MVKARASRRMYFQPLPHEKRTSEQDPKGVSRGVSDRSVCFPPSIRSSNLIFTSDLYFNSIFLESQTRNTRGSGYRPNAELLITQTCDAMIVRSSICEVLQLSRSDMFSLVDPTKPQDIQRRETRFQLNHYRRIHVLSRTRKSHFQRHQTPAASGEPQSPESEHCVNHWVIVMALAIVIVMYSICVCITICASQPSAVAVAT